MCLSAEDWIQNFEQYNISVGASLDGLEVYNDEQRILTNGQGSYGSEKQGIIKLRDAHKNGRIPSFGLLCVINPKSDGREVYNHFVNDLEVKNMDFLFPAMNHDDFVYDHGYEKFMGSALDAWIDGGFKDVSIRKFSTALLKFSGINKFSLGGYSDLDMVTISFTIQSNGDLGPDDLLFQSPIWNAFPKCNVVSTSLYDYLLIEQFEKLDKELRTIPEQCTDCCWSKICGGGTNAVHLKYSSKNNSCINPTVYCDSMKELYSRMSAKLLDEGVPYKKISEVLCLE
ncbi:hypothetical protein HC752_14165 [Vibrio sp. S9_S30]|uniref:hypothetical protein n=1 Tax=Vibrio sp. S9_S30 TaxID=2720226 RepID=UPI001681B94E|nr:hypothetical protein [Vibrio sp. S9_S30]MBD1558081.1 hypothetical protein [Vibrio sp. S9_S30]